MVFTFLKFILLLNQFYKQSKSAIKSNNFQTNSTPKNKIKRKYSAKSMDERGIFDNRLSEIPDETLEIASLRWGKHISHARCDSIGKKANIGNEKPKLEGRVHN